MKNQINIIERAKSSLFFLSFKNLSLSFNNKQIFSDISFDIVYNRILLIKGPVGAGKSSFLKLLAGFIDAQTGLFIHLHNNNPVKSIYLHSQAEFNFMTGYVNDEILISGGDIGDFSEYAGRSIYDLSGGELKKLSIMIAASSEESCVMLLDEPLDMLDDNEAASMASFIIERSKTRPFIIATHDNHFDDIADVIIEIHR